MSVLLDTNVLVGAFDARDGLHEKARLLLRRLQDEAAIATDHILLEGWNLIRERVGYDGAERFVGELTRSPSTIECVTAVDLERARWIGESWADQQFDLVDRTSFAVMERLGCSRVATFDRDFAVYRYGRDRRDAFEVLS